MIVLNNEVVKIITEIVGAGRAAVSVKDAKETDLRPFDVDVRLAFWLKNV